LQESPFEFEASVDGSVRHGPRATVTRMTITTALPKARTERTPDHPPLPLPVFDVRTRLTVQSLYLSALAQSRQARVENLYRSLTRAVSCVGSFPEP
jgi:hypothetical protein